MPCAEVDVRRERTKQKLMYRLLSVTLLRPDFLASHRLLSH